MHEHAQCPHSHMKPVKSTMNVAVFTGRSLKSVKMGSNPICRKYFLPKSEIIVPIKKQSEFIINKTDFKSILKYVNI